MLLGDLIQGLSITPANTAPLTLRICDLTEDSRTVLPGSLFIARAGLKSDGRAFIGDAISAGASAILTEPGVRFDHDPSHVVHLISPDVPLATAQLAERYFGGPASQLDLFGVTGTNGKTTISYFLYQLLRAARRRPGLIGTVFIDDGEGLVPSGMTTPPALEISHTLSRMVEHGYGAAALEVSSHALDQRRADGLRFAAAIFTNLTGDHLDYHGTMEQYAAAKARLFALLRPGGAAVINVDDPYAERMVRDCAGHILRCSARPGAHADCSVAAGAPSLAGFDAVFRGPWGEANVHLPLIGAHNAMNVLQCIAALHSAGVPIDRFESRLSKLVAPPGRLERVTRDWTPSRSVAGGLERTEPFTVLVDYSHSDDSLEKALSALRPLLPDPSARLRVVFGCGGDRDRAKRPRMGAVAARHADAVIVTSDNPRTENPSAIIREILGGIPREALPRVHVDADRRAAIHRAVNDAEPGDIILIAGKGHEDYQLVPDGAGGILRLDFDDRVVTRDALRERARHEHEHAPPAPAIATAAGGAAIKPGARASA